jgi:SAM-dependent methyltransferase
MNNAFDLLNGYYTAYDEEGRLASRHGSVEFLTTVRYIERYLRPGMKILEIGAATGRHSHYFARRGYEVDAVELIPHNIELFRENTQDGENVRIFEGNAVDLSMFADDTYDIVLLLGPMYHLFTDEERTAALSEAVRVTKPGGVMMTAYCMNEGTVINYLFGKHKIFDESLQELIDCGVNHIYVSLNGSIEAINRKSRDGYALAIRALELLQKKAFANTHINWVMHSFNTYDFPAMLKLAEEYGVSELVVLVFKPNAD